MRNTIKNFFRVGVVAGIVLGVGFCAGLFFFGVAQGEIFFYDSLIPASDNTFKLGDATRSWGNINDSMFFDGGNVGFGGSFAGAPIPSQRAVVSRGIQLHTVGSKACDSNARGGFLVFDHGVATDTLEVCIRNASGIYLWATLY